MRTTRLPATNVSLADGLNTFTASAQDSSGRSDSSTAFATLPASANLIYDLNGNLRTNANNVLTFRIYDYDDENQLIRVTEPASWKSEFTYDGKMRRRIRKEFTWQNAAWVQTKEVRYIYDGNLVIQERDANNLPTIGYTRGKDLSGSLEGAGGIGGLLAFSQLSTLTPQHAYYHADGNGNVTMLINSLQVGVAKYLYDPSGNAISSAGALAEANLYRFSSKEIHAGAGLSCYLHRWYDPAVSRWLNRDAHGEEGGLNLYAFVANDPIAAFDPFGLDTCIVYAGNLICIPANPDPKDPLKPDRGSPKGFSLCQRDLQKDSSCDCPTMIGNAVGGEHSYLQYINNNDNKWGYGWAGGPKGVPEGHFKPNSCNPCKKGKGSLKYGSGTGKSGSGATDAEVKDCIKNNPPTKPFVRPATIAEHGQRRRRRTVASTAIKNSPATGRKVMKVSLSIALFVVGGLGVLLAAEFTKLKLRVSFAERQVAIFEQMKASAETTIEFAAIVG